MNTSSGTEKCGYCAIIGRPDAGKSTLMNHLIGQKIAITSRKPQTTRDRVRGYLTDERGQIIFTDTPGMTDLKGGLGKYMTSGIKKAVSDADVIVVVCVPAYRIHEEDRLILDTVRDIGKPVLLCLNKIDVFDRDLVEKSVKMYGEHYGDPEVTPVSALKDINTDALICRIFEVLPVGPCLYDPEYATDESVRDIAAEIVREKALRLLRDEVPHGIAVVIESVKELPEIMHINAVIYCERESHKGIIIGKGARMIKRIGTEARTDIEKLTGTHVNLSLSVKVRQNWKDSASSLKEFGYSEGRNGQ
ncbi:MAG: GTPase Era [Lachnospiraceae bacterium]|nr:GTPase Era [Lachnospiraceae bacterium]